LEPGVEHFIKFEAMKSARIEKRKRELLKKEMQRNETPELSELGERFEQQPQPTNREAAPLKKETLCIFISSVYILDPFLPFLSSNFQYFGAHLPSSVLTITSSTFNLDSTISCPLTKSFSRTLPAS
jgi:hypothetical protein